MAHGHEQHCGFSGELGARLLRAIARLQPDPATGKSDPARIKAFLAAHPEAARALALIKKRQVTSGFANSTFNGLNAFRFVDAAGSSAPVRWSVVPVQPVATDAAEQPEAGGENYLFDDLIAQIAQHPRQLRLIVTIGQAGDPTNDATQPWPEGRQQVDAGNDAENLAKVDFLRSLPLQTSVARIRRSVVGLL
jgi:catalase